MADTAQAISRIQPSGGAAQVWRTAPPQGKTPGEQPQRLKRTRELFWHYWLPVLMMLTLIALESTDAMSGAHTGRLLRLFARWLGHPLNGDQLDLLNLIMRKSGHVVGYGLLGASWLLLLRGSYWLRHDYQLCLKFGTQIRRLWWRPVWGALAVFATYLVASADEFHQMSIPSRTGCWQDIGIDTSAAVSVMFLFWIRARWRCRREH